MVLPSFSHRPSPFLAKPAAVISLALCRGRICPDVLCLLRLDGGRVGELLQSRIERERIDRRDLGAFVEDVVDLVAVDGQAIALRTFGSL